MVDIDAITGDIVDAAVKLHMRLGPGLFESVYQQILARDLEKRGHKAERQKLLSFDYEAMHFDIGLRVDLLVDDYVVVELKSVEEIVPVHMKQVLTYLRVLGLPVGLLINFGEIKLKSGIRRIVNKYMPTVDSVLRINQSF